jgi:hypothetical protein
MTEDVIYIVGGKGENGVELNDLCAYKIKSKKNLVSICTYYIYINYFFKVDVGLDSKIWVLVHLHAMG